MSSKNQESNVVITERENESQLDSHACSLPVIKSLNEQADTETRRRVPTEKGREFQMDLARRELHKALKMWRRDVQNSESALADAVDTLTLQDLRKRQSSSFDALSNSHEELASLADASESLLLTKDYEL